MPASAAAVKPIWLSKSESARLCGISVRQYSDVIVPRLAKKAIKGRGKTLKHDAVQVVAALVEYRLELAQPDDETDPLLTGGSSPNLERYRLVKAKMAEMDLDVRMGKLIEAETFQAAIRPALAVFRGTGDRLARQFGNDAADIYNEGVAELETAALNALKAFDGIGGGGDNAAGGRPGNGPMDLPDAPDAAAADDR